MTRKKMMQFRRASVRAIEEALCQRGFSSYWLNTHDSYYVQYGGKCVPPRTGQLPIPRTTRELWKLVSNIRKGDF